MLHQKLRFDAGQKGGREGGRKETREGGSRNKTIHVILSTGTNSLCSLVKRLTPSGYRMNVRCNKMKLSIVPAQCLRVPHAVVSKQ
jgi:hypothetical protein